MEQKTIPVDMVFTPKLDIDSGSQWYVGGVDVTVNGHRLVCDGMDHNGIACLTLDGQEIIKHVTIGEVWKAFSNLCIALGKERKDEETDATEESN